MGGMGNQMFQYAMGLASARRLGVGLRLDITWFNEWLKKPCPFPSWMTPRGYSLNLWEGVTQPAEAIEPRNLLIESGTYNEFMAQYSCILTDETHLMGYWQSEKYFSEIREELLRIFRPKQPPTPRGSKLMEMIAKEGERSAALCVRVSDLGPEYGFGTPMEYYREACRVVNEHTPDSHFFVFSNDVEVCKKHFTIPYRFTITEANDMTTVEHLGREDEDLWAMRSCHNAVTVASSYAWWGAWLNPVPDSERIVVAPKHWFSEVSAPDSIPERWVKL
jgi:hypothetical protein